ncbi:MAG: hypothetical protein HQL56_01195 [Magnetococcales bacterium]|nr:hypothetical protein [Magnetococcales bacterium]
MSFSCWIGATIDAVWTETDLSARLTNFQIRKRSGTPSYVQATSKGSDFADAILAALGAEDPELWIMDGATELCRVTLERVSDSRGADSKSVTISGNSQSTNSSPTTKALSGVSVWRSENGIINLTCLYDPTVDPGDTVTWGGNSFVADEVVITASPESLTMEVQQSANG